MLKHKRLKVGRKHVEALSIKLLDKHLVLIRGRKGYVMCGYLDISAAQKCGDVAVKITGVASIEEALKADVFACTSSAKKSGIFKGQPIREVISIIA